MIITLNEEDRIQKCIQSVKFCDEILVVDSGSTDRTQEIAKSLGARVITHPFQSYGLQKQFAIQSATHDWVLVVDADEWATPQFAQEWNILREKSQLPDGFYIKICLSLFGSTFKFGKETRRRNLRLFNRKKITLISPDVHETFVVPRSENFNGTLFHESYRNLEHYMKKMCQYTSLAAKKEAAQSKRSATRIRLLLLPRILFKFFRVTFLELHFLNGFPGFLWGFLCAMALAIKDIKTLEVLRGQNR